MVQAEKEKRVGVGNVRTVAQAGVDGGTAMIPMYFDFIAPGLCAGDLDGNWVLWLVHQRDFTLGGLIDTGSSPC